MTLKEYATYINLILEKHPEADMIYQSDNPKKPFKFVRCLPEPGYFENNDFNGKSDIINAVCIN